MSTKLSTLTDSLLLCITLSVITTAEAAKKLGVSVDRVQALIRDGRLPATRFGKAYAINEKDLVFVRTRKPGRPRKTVSKRKRT